MNSLPEVQSTDEAGRLRRLFQFFADTQCRGRSLVYETLSKGVAGNDALLDMLMRTPSEQRRPSLLFAAANLILAAHPDAALASYYPVHGGRRPVDEHLVAAFAAFCAEHDDELSRLLHTKSTQTNEIRRCAALRLGLSHVHQHRPGPLALAEVGASAGLNLLFDRHHYRIGGQETVSAAASPVMPALRGPLAGRNGLYLVGASLRDAGRHDDSLIAMADPYLRWLAPARTPADDFQWLPAG
ncbi:DUF2332 family protein [Nonomuraea sp. NEAU-A123]|uniref:DUF2332 family protein n=1 Tax=Nonomuraea sp. NEAU-A123 TaxID=2839649 RepID=UPI001BE4E02D|nr:DUF2332 family protein [Nonomuraea sp. NEAU-A123]MBT2233930.1 DUF2332 family protein [Nonomuraea sp. NEAU-A123]